MYSVIIVSFKSIFDEILSQFRDASASLQHEFTLISVMNEGKPSQSPSYAILILWMIWKIAENTKRYVNYFFFNFIYYFCWGTNFLIFLNVNFHYSPEPQTTKINSASSQGPTGELSSTIFYKNKKTIFNLTMELIHHYSFKDNTA